MTVRKVLAGLWVVAAALAAQAGAAAQTQQPPARGAAQQNRFFIRFVEDAAIVDSYWLEGRLRFEDNQPAFDENLRSATEANTLEIGPVFAMNVAEDFEFGARVGVAFRDPDSGGGDTGLTDMDLWGKISVVTDPVKISLGILITAPTGDEDKFLGSGETNVEFFGGLRKEFHRVTFAGNVGVRINQDPGFDGLDVEGKNSLLFGAGAIFQTSDNLALIAEWALETERFEGLKNDSRLLGGFELKPHESYLIRGAVGGGLSDGSPDFQLQGSVVWLF